MKVRVECSDCNKTLQIEQVNMALDATNDVIIQVKHCNNIGCYDCGGCETKEENDKLKEALSEIEVVVIKNKR